LKVVKQLSSVGSYNRILETWPQAAAEAILRIGFNETDRERMTILLERAKAGVLTNEEAEALEHYRHIGKLLELMKSRAPRSLQTSPA